ncbi:MULTISPECIES: glycosyltransferase [unclassified Polaribacter]|uniref:glycosyltransferase n=1 Tax=unclassified Polaribacter TaxID=196858 RepID=UPI0011BED4CC|nr:MULTISPECIES: glycosyltransferase [unclassified Polaribacter]TXD50968.1 glycosyltransferase [Polaribacter sp. IC063]TXD57785.1 glycosyltransferase [Polaribacter sp. IC066]
MILTVVFYSFVACTAIQIIYYLLFSTFLFKQKKKDAKTEHVPVSVIVYSKNNTSELEDYLPFIIDQEYPIFEIVLINNASSDDSIDTMKAFQKKHENIKIVSVENNEAFWNNKKYALTLGIKAAKHDHLLFTNATSKPLSKTWIAQMSSKFTFKRTIVLAYTKIKREKSFTNLLIRFHNLLKALKCFSFAKTGTPFLAFSNNLAYTKADFFKVNGFINHLKIKNGEDDLFIRDAATKKNITFTIAEASFTETDAQTSFKEWFQDVRITNSLREHYKFKHRFLLGLFIFSKTLFYILAAVLFFFYPYNIIGAFVGVYVLVQYLVIGFSAKKLQETQLLFFLPFLEIALLLIQISIFSANLISKPNHWK